MHVKFNRRPDLSRPLNAQQGDDQNEWSFLFGLLVDDAKRRGLSDNEFYYVGKDLLKFSVAYQGYGEWREAVENEELSRIRFMHEIWRWMPEEFYTNLASELARTLLLRE